jgi:hypothetical protein
MLYLWRASRFIYLREKRNQDIVVCSFSLLWNDELAAEFAAAEMKKREPY